MASKAWYLLPLVFALPGGIIHYAAVRKDDPKQAKRGLILGAVFTGVWILNLAIGFSASLIR